MTNYSVVISDRTHYGALSDLSLSGDKVAWSMSVWVKFVSGTSGISVIGNNKSTTGTGGSSLLFDSSQQAEMMAENIAFAPAWIPVASDGVCGQIAPAVTWIDDGTWHNIIGTYDSTIVGRSITTVTDGTHLVVDDTSTMTAGDRIFQGFFSTVITTVTDSTHLIVSDTTHFSSGRFVCRGIALYLDGALINIFADYEYTLFGNSFSCDIPFGIGDPEQANYFSRLGSYAYPAVYNRILSAAEASAIAAGNNISSGAVGQWLFTEGSGLTAADSSGNGHTLTFNAIDSWSTDVPFIPGTITPKQKASTLLII